jgi:ubiquinone biosynthesis protein
MGFIKTSIKITRTIKNVARLKEIAIIFAKNGFDEFISSGVISKVPNFVLPKSKLKIREELLSKSKRDWGQVIGHRLRLCFQELGPTFIKLGQLLSTREDIFDSSFISEMKVLRDQVKGIQFEEAKKNIEESLGKKLSELFKSFDQNAIGNASIGVVYRARLLDGRKVVVKVRRPGIVKEIETDFSIMMFLISQAEKISEEIRYLGISRMVRDFSLRLQNEVNFNIEALNAERIEATISKHDPEKIFYLPKVHKEYLKEDVLIMDEVEGIPFTNTQEITKGTSEVFEKLEKGVKIFIKSFLQEGFFHADLHGGNFFLMKDNRIGLIDFGLVGNLSRKSRENFIAIIYGLLTFNYENLVYEFLDVASYEKIPDVDKLITDVRESLSSFVGLTVSQTNFSQVLKSIISTLNRHEIFLPTEWFIVFRALMTLDGVGKSIGLDLDLFSLLDGDIKNIVKNTMTKEALIEESIWSGRDMLSAMRIIPRHIKWFLKEASKKKYAIELINRGYEEQIKSINTGIYFLGYSIISSSLFFCGVLFSNNKEIVYWKDVPPLSWIFWSGAIMFLFKGILTKK